MKTCPKCGADFPDHLIVCSRCDVRLQRLGKRSDEVEERHGVDDEERPDQSEREEFIKNIDNVSFEDIWLIIEAGLDDFLELLKQHWLEEKILLNSEFGQDDKVYLLENFHDYGEDDAKELVRATEKELRDRRLWDIKRKVSQKVSEIMGDVPPGPGREVIPDDVKIYVWRRDQGKCVKCSGQTNLEYDHIIPVVKGGSNTERNLQLLCERCNRSKSDDVC